MRIEAPLKDQHIVGDQIGVSAVVGGIEVIDRIGRKPAKGEGHLIFYLGVADIPTQEDEPAYSGAGTYEVVAGTRHIWEDVEPGEYDVGVQLVNNDDTPLEPPVKDQIRVTVSLTFKNEPGNTPPVLPSQPG